MTHDELHDYIDNFDCAGMVNQPIVKALRAVVALHKPNLAIYDDGSGCLCNNEYPCPTIQAIAKELG